MPSLSDIDVTTFPPETKDRLLAGLYGQAIYARYRAKLDADHNFELPIEKKTELLNVALALHIKKPSGTISALRQQAEALRTAGVSIFPEITDLGEFTEAIYTPIKAEAIAAYETHKQAVEALFA